MMTDVCHNKLGMSECTGQDTGHSQGVSRQCRDKSATLRAPGFAEKRSTVRRDPRGGGLASGAQALGK